MNDTMRRWMDEDDADEIAEQPAQREEPASKRPPNLDRRQKEKEWGRAIAKQHRERRKSGLVRDKP